jgi:hypothetical protein
LRIHREDEKAELELRGQLINDLAVISSNCHVTIGVQWIMGKTKEYYDLVVEVAEQLRWIVASFKEPPEEGLSFTRANIEYPFPAEVLSWNDEDRCPKFEIVYNDASDQELGDDNGICWHQPFTGLNVAVGFPIPHRPDGMRGVELPFFLMTAFAGVGYSVAYKGGFVLKGWQNALFPTRTDSNLDLSGAASAIQWHLFRSKRHRLYMMEAKKTEPALLPLRTKLSLTEFYPAIEQTKRHFLGLYQDSRICIGTNDSRADDIAPVHFDENLEESRLRQLVEWTRVVNFSFGGGMHGISSGISTGIRIRTLKERQLRLDLGRTWRNLINATCNNSTILFNVKTRIAWMLPQICVVMQLLQAWTKANYSGTQIDYPAFDDMSPDHFECDLRRFLKQQAAVEAHIALEENFIYFANVLNQLQDDEELKPAKRGNSRRLAGVDFAQLATQPETFSIITTDINIKSGGDWLQMLKSDWKDPQTPYRVITLFCDNLVRQPIEPTAQVCDTWFPPPVDHDYLIAAMHCLKKLAELYGRDPIKLSREHIWQRGSYGPYETCNGRSCNRVQKVVNGSGRRDTDISNIVSNASAQAAVVFGCGFNVDLQRSCQPTSPSQPALEPRRPLSQPPVLD